MGTRFNPLLAILIILAIQLFFVEGIRANESKKQKTLNWIDQFRKEQALFPDKEIERLRKEISEGTEEQAKQWLTETAEIREALDSPQWKETRRWLKDFLNVQAIYSEEQIESFRQDAQEAAQSRSSKEFIDMLQEIEDLRNRLSRGAANSQRIREQKLELSQAFRQRAFEERESARRAAARSATAAPVNQAKPDVRKEYRTTRPLVDSLDAARWSVMRNFWRPW